MDHGQYLKMKIKFLKLLPKAATAVNFQPVRDDRRTESRLYAIRVKAHTGRGSSSLLQTMPMVPARARSWKQENENGSFEPISPKVSCMGQIKRKKKNFNVKRSVSLPKAYRELKKYSFKLTGVFIKSTRKKMGASDDHRDTLLLHTNIAYAPSLSQMKQFASGREALAKYDWSAPQRELEKTDYQEWNDHHYFYSDEELAEEDEPEDQVVVRFSATTKVGGRELSLKPRKEINLWKRRSMAAPPALELNVTVK